MFRKKNVQDQRKINHRAWTLVQFIKVSWALVGTSFKELDSWRTLCLYVNTINLVIKKFPTPITKISKSSSSRRCRRTRFRHWCFAATATRWPARPTSSPSGRPSSTWRGTPSPTSSSPSSSSCSATAASGMMTHDQINSDTFEWWFWDQTRTTVNMSAAFCQGSKPICSLQSWNWSNRVVN